MTLFFYIYIIGDYMYLSKILSLLDIHYKLPYDLNVLDVTRYTEKINKGIIYVSYDEKYNKEAIKKGVEVIIGDYDFIAKDIIYIKVNNIKKTYAKIVNILYKKYIKKIKFIGVTGTNGKTTTSTLIYEFLKYNKLNSIYIGSNGIFYGDVKYNTLNTTPDIYIVFNAIKEALKYNIKYAIIESSSIALSELRLFNIKFDYAILTNISEDHFDYHKNIDRYVNAKGILFSNAKCAIINTDSTYWDYFDNLCFRSLYYGKNSFFPVNYEIKKDYSTFLIDNNSYKTNLLGIFNIYNILALIILAKDLNLMKKMKQFLLDFKSVDGRMCVFHYNKKTIIVDYAHTPDAIKEVLINVKKMGYKSIWTVCGAGGNRDKEKRKLMGNMLSLYSDYIILTNDNPRLEDENEIINDIGMGINKNYKVILDRKKAIKEAIMLSTYNDCILILGKGNEKYIIKNNENILHSDILYVKNIIGD